MSSEITDDLGNGQLTTYVFETKCRRFGYIQRDNERLVLCIQTSPAIAQGTEYNHIDLTSIYAINKEIFSTAFETVADTINFGLHKCSFEGTRPKVSENSIIKVSAGTYNPRMNRDSTGLYRHLLASGKAMDEVRAYYNIYEAMESVFKVVEPTQQNLAVYGHRIREILIVSCTEVEYLLKQFLLDNKYPKKNGLSTKHYIEALPILRLNEYSVVLRMHPELGKFSPFKNWEKNAPTASLDWYESYNSVKHNRGDNFNQATLRSLINSVAAVHILLQSMYGRQIFETMHSQFSSCFSTHIKPTWKLTETAIPHSYSKPQWFLAIPYFTSTQNSHHKH